jgi:hypothetical protein
MMRKVLVFAYDQPAVRKMVGMAGVIFSDKPFENLRSSFIFGRDPLRTELTPKIDRFRLQDYNICSNRPSARSRTIVLFPALFAAASIRATCIRPAENIDAGTKRARVRGTG